MVPRDMYINWKVPEVGFLDPQPGPQDSGLGPFAAKLLKYRNHTKSVLIVPLYFVYRNIHVLIHIMDV